MSETPKSEVEKEIKFLEQMLACTNDEFWRERIKVKLQQLRSEGKPGASAESKKHGGGT